MAYEPHFVPKPFAEGVWIADGPHIPLARVPVPVRMTIVRLADGGLWLHSPIDARASLVEAVRALGPIRHLVAPNQVHLSWMPPWHKAAPEAKCWGAPGVASRARRKGLDVPWEPPLGDEAPLDWAGEIDQMIVEGSPVHREAAFLHRPSRTLILTDIIENLEPRTLPFWLRPFARLAGATHPDGRAPLHLRAAFTDRKALRGSVERMIAWDPERIVVAHGRPFESDGVAELRRAFRWA